MKTLEILAAVVIALPVLHSQPARAQLTLEAYELLPDPLASGWDLSVTTDGLFVVVGAAEATGAAIRSGLAFVYDAATGNLLHVLHAPDALENDEFGRSVMITGTKVIVGAPFATTGPVRSGAVYLFDISDGQFLAKLTLPLPLADQSAQFGRELAVSGDRLFVGTPYYSGSSNSGYVYEIDLTTLALSHAYSLNAGGGSQGAEYGRAIAANDERLAISSRKSVHLIDTSTRSTVAWIEAPVPGTQAAGFGESVALDGFTLLVGSPNQSTQLDSAGAAHAFEAATGTLRATLNAPLLESGDDFGWSVALLDGRAFVSNPRHDDLFGHEIGTVYGFDAASGALRSQLLASNATTGSSPQNLGLRVSAANGTLVTTRPYATSAAYVYRLTDCNNNGLVDAAELGARSSVDCNGNGRPDECDLKFGSSTDLDHNAVPDDCIAPPLRADRYTLSVSSGGFQQLFIRAGAAHGLQAFWLLGSISGTTPGIVNPYSGATIPLVSDIYFNHLLYNGGAGVLLPHFGLLDPFGNSTSRIQLPTTLASAFVGTTLYHSYITLDIFGFGSPSATSNAVPLLLVP